MKNGVNKGLCGTYHKNRERKTKRPENSYSGTAQPGTLFRAEFPTLLFRQIPKETRNHFIFYFLLKSEAPGSGWISNYSSQISSLSRKFGISESEFIFYLQQIEMLKVAFLEGNKIRLIGWKQLGRILKVDTLSRIEIPFRYGRGQASFITFISILCNK